VILYKENLKPQEALLCFAFARLEWCSVISLLEVRGKPFYDALVNRWILYVRRQWLTLILTAVCGLLAVDFFTGPAGLRDLVVLRERRAQLEAAHKELLKSNAALKLKLSRLHDDDRYLERRIREQLGYVRPDELVYRFATEDSSPGSARDSSADHQADR
jgi:cell division protein FtsB